MKKYSARPTRLVDLAPDQDPAQVGPLVRSAIEAPAEPLPRVKWRIRATLRPRVRPRGRVLRLALVGTCMFVAGGVVGAAVQPLLRAVTSASPRPDDDQPNPARERRQRRAQLGTPAQALPTPPVANDLVEPPLPSVPAPPDLPSPPELAPPAKPVAAPTGIPAPRPTSPAMVFKAPPAVDKSTDRLSRPRPDPALASAAAPVFPAPRAAIAPAASPPAPPSSPNPPVPSVSDEQRLLATALDRLRSGRDPRAALVALDEYRAKFPGGVLAPEAARLRTEALLLLGRKTAVLDELDRSVPAETPAGDERLLVRAELRAAAGRWRAALEDYDAVLGARAPELAGEGAHDQRSRERIERALWGRASARSRVGDDSGARADLAAYLRLCPDGRFAARAHQLLAPR